MLPMLFLQITNLFYDISGNTYLTNQEASFKIVLKNYNEAKMSLTTKHFSTILVEKCLVAGTYFTQQAASQNVTGRSVGTFQ
jgi:hypothetical protein